MDVASYLACGVDVPSDSVSTDDLGRWFGSAYLAGAQSACDDSTRYSGNISTSTSNKFYNPAIKSNWRTSKQRDTKRKKKNSDELYKQRCVTHGFLVRHLEALLDGVAGIDGVLFADKWIEQVRKCPGYTRRHGSCGKLSFTPLSCRFPLCPHCSARKAMVWRKSLEGLIEAVGIVAPKLLTLSMPAIPTLGEREGRGRWRRGVEVGAASGVS